ncbi:DnaB-like helicase C-terminal domain-containing protein [Amycolatopsis sp. NPDC051373]|uniref:replicative DNA helicase n=1 Tax=Amycolatopsis sp. NPDC051373 TaxID=3155801 RepID=UPI0034505AE7
MTEPIDQLDARDEERYLASLLLTSTLHDLRDKALKEVSPDDFADARYGGLWAAARSLNADGRRIPQRELVKAAREQGGSSVEHLLSTLSSAVPRAADFPVAFAEVRRCGQLRRLIVATQRIQQRAMAAEEFSQALSAAHEELAALDTDELEGTETKSYGSLLKEFRTAMTTLDDYQIMPTPWPEVNDEIAGGLHGGRLYIVGARPGEGKSVLSHNLAEHAAANDYPALVFSVEMGGLEVAGRMVANGATIETGEISRRELSAYSWQQFDEYETKAANYPLYVNDRADLSLSYVKSECRAHQRRHGLSVVVIDYLQLLKAELNAPREQQVAHLSRSLKELSRELDVAVVVPAQLNRKAVDRERPSLADLRESGGIEADADVVMLLARELSDQGDPTGQLGVTLAKNRHGRICDLTLAWRPHFSRVG